MKSTYQKLAITFASAVLGLAIVMGSSPSLADSSYTFTVTDHDGDILVSGTFSGKYSNRNGWIDSNEVTNFSIQQTFHHYYGNYYGINELKFSISHTKEDLKLGSFKFDEANWKRRKDGKAILEFQVYGGKGIVKEFGFLLEQGDEKAEDEKGEWQVVYSVGEELYNSLVRSEEDLAVWVKRGR